jgi:hypothetical protein
MFKFSKTTRVVGWAAAMWFVAGGVSQGAEQWQPLLQTDSAPAWRGWKTEGLPAGWQVQHGVLSKSGGVEDLVTVAEYADFELEFEWKIGRGGNSGVFYRGTRQYDHVYWSAPEYQLLDDANAADGKDRLTSTAADYGLYAAPAGINQWNRSRIVVQGSVVEHWLNGRQVVRYRLGDEDWLRRVAASKFRDYPEYGKAPRGLIALQGDHEGALAFRRMRIRAK